MPVSKKPKKKRVQTRKHETIGSFAIMSDANGNASFSIDESGRISSSQGVEGSYTIRTTYARDSGKEKVVFEHNAGLSGGYLNERAQLCDNFERLAAIDTNVSHVDGQEIYVSCFAISKNVLNQTDPDVDFTTHAFYFFGVPEGIDKEMVGLDIALHNMVRPALIEQPCRMGIVMDSNLGAHKSINSRALPYLGENLLDPELKLIYASTDSGVQLVNEVLKKCDSLSKRVAKHLASNPDQVERTGANYKYCKNLVRFDLSKLPNNR